MALIDYKMAATMLEAKKKGVQDKLLAMDFLKKVPRAEYGSLLTELDNLFSRGAEKKKQKNLLF